ncbi:MAG: MaoC family dehydratase [Euryarchaeota archaeon]|nr:MaoC family dehydratase [Euryarchaeota archaeon]
MPGLYYEEFEPGRTYRHEPGRTITEADNVLFCSLTMNTQPLHLDHEWAKNESPFGKPVVNGILTFALSVGLSVRDLTEGTLVANMGYEDLKHPAPVFHGDTVRVSSEVESKRLTSKPGRGLVTIRHVVTNQDGTEVCSYRRTVMVKTKDPSLVKQEGKAL